MLTNKKQITNVLMWVVFASSLFVVCCGDGKVENGDPNSNQQPKPPTQWQKKMMMDPAQKANTPATPDTVNANNYALKEIHFSPEKLNINNPITAVPELEKPEAGVAFEYRWYVNGKEVAENPTNTLNTGSFKKKDFVYCRARATIPGKETPWLKSVYLQIPNYPPEIESGMPNSFSIPGEFVFQIRAHDEDNETLTYSLLGPTDAGITIDAASGMIKWKLDADIVKKVGESVEIKFEVSDSDGGKAQGSIVLKFTAEKPKEK